MKWGMAVANDTHVTVRRCIPHLARVDQCDATAARGRYRSAFG
jgi:hypothetical protein